jgi:hypothetical protein
MGTSQRASMSAAKHASKYTNDIYGGGAVHLPFAEESVEIAQPIRRIPVPARPDI